jgi:two-component system cell cycle sensor histidine kinase PleC
VAVNSGSSLMSSFGRPHFVMEHDEACDWTAGRLASALPPIPAWASCAEVFRILNEADGQRAAAIVDNDGHVVGLVNRLQFLARYSKRFTPELFDKRSITTLANPDALIVDEHMPVGDLANLIASDHPDALRECFVVTRGGTYLGIGTSEALVKAKVAMLTERERQLNAALVAAEDADRTRANFLALMSHELRTPLNAIIGFSEVLSNELFGPHSVPRYGEYARDIHGAGRHLLALINDILDLSKSESGKLELYIEPVEVGPLIRECMKLVAVRAADGQVSLHTNVPPDLPALRADTLRIKQIVLNLLSNAVKFTMPGGHVEASAMVNDSGGVEIAVADTGIGMEPEMIPIALEPFRQIDSPLSRNVEGTGLGLSLAKSLTECHGGTIEIESEPRKGTIVRLKMPPGRTIWMEDAEARSA